MILSNILLQTLKNIFYLYCMTLSEAFKELTESEEYKQICKGTDSHSSKYRIYFGRFRDNTLKAGALVEILLANGYEVKANRVSKKKK